MRPRWRHRSGSAAEESCLAFCEIFLRGATSEKGSGKNRRGHVVVDREVAQAIGHGITILLVHIVWWTAMIR